MNKDEILERSRRENRDQDEMEKETLAKAGQRACAVGGAVCMVVVLLEALFARQVNMSTWAVYLSMTGTMLLVKYAQLKERHELIFGLLQLGMAAVLLIFHVVRLAR